MLHFSCKMFCFYRKPSYICHRKVIVMDITPMSTVIAQRNIVGPFFWPILKDMAVAIPYTLMPSGESLLLSKRDVQPSPFFALWPGRFRNLESNSVCKTKSLSLNLGEHSVLRTISVRK
jgi:hypothetical protein